MTLRSKALLALCAAAALAAAGALAASRPHFGGSATVAYAGGKVSGDPLLADAPAEAALLHLTTAGLCREGERGLSLELARELGRPSPDQLVITLAPGLKSRAGMPLTALDVATAWARAFEASPYRALFAPIRGGEAAVRGAARGREQLGLSLAFAWPDLEASLCHPALAITVPAGFGARTGVGPFVAGSPGALQASPTFPGGRPFLDRLRVAVGDDRGAARELGLGHAQVELNGEAGLSGPLRFATYLLFRADRVGPAFRDSLEASIDREDLVRLFVRAPAAPMPALLPGAAAPARGSGPAKPPAQPITLLYDNSLDSQRGVAERIALKLHDRGYDVRLAGLGRADLRVRWARGDYDLMLQSVLLPSEEGPALAIALELSGRHDLLARELPPVGALPELAARDALALQRATALTSAGSAIPLFVQGVRLKLARTVTGPPLDRMGVPDLANAALAVDGQLVPPGGR